ncbi:tetratricopeptide repeat protein [Terasakiella sp. A23]|uniref:tetratricopeptide repeat protein n=1 Tax=Terasakiella sp. FCG-A23 TaxID=3080561 RepID=UPI002953A071|nr:tetratricopeptide repeat protein [Terasakiella sp. A23]MDV7341373.1 tetratricopeptide repeat protein [Terasakiella sp. A23]
MKTFLYLLALVLAVVTAIGYVVGKGWEKEAEIEQAEASKGQMIKMWYRNAKDGDPESQYKLAVFYEAERTDYLNAQKWYRVAATKGQHAGAQYKLAQLYLNGRGVENDLPSAMKWFRLSSAQGDVRAQFFMGVANRDGWEKKPDFIEAYKWFLLANKDAAKVIAEEERFDPTKALAEMTPKMSTFDRKEAQKRADKWRPK